MTTNPRPVSLPEPGFEAFDLLNFGEVKVPARPIRFGFQVDVNPSTHLSQVVFGLVQPTQPGRSVRRVGFAVRIDLERGEIWDAVNGSGLIGWVEEPLACASKSDHPESFLLSLEIERVGTALLPKLQVGGEEWLYPAVRSVDEMELLAIAGCGGGVDQQSDPALVFTAPNTWAEG